MIKPDRIKKLGRILRERTRNRTDNIIRIVEVTENEMLEFIAAMDGSKCMWRRSPTYYTLYNVAKELNKLLARPSVKINSELGQMIKLGEI